jgi:hypothetical protein
MHQDPFTVVERDERVGDRLPASPDDSQLTDEGFVEQSLHRFG